MTQGFGDHKSIKVVRVHITSSVKWKSIFAFFWVTEWPFYDSPSTQADHIQHPGLYK